MVICVEVTCKSNNWNSRFNGTLEEARNYFLNNSFNVGVYPMEKIEIPYKVELIEIIKD